MPLSNAQAAESAAPLLDRYEEVEALAEQIRSQGVMGLDTEFISERTYHPQLALLQVSTPDGIFLIDPLAEHIQKAPDQPIWELMADREVVTVVHAHDQESRFCLQRTGRAPGNLFDVQLAAAFNGFYYPIAYDRLVGGVLRRSLGSSQSRTNWLRRPLTAAQMRYAADDVRHLLPLKEAFTSRMTGDDGRRLRWLREETKQRLDRLSDRETDRWRRLSGANKLSPRSLAALRELSAWRESTAQRHDMPFRRVASDDLLVSLAATRPASESELASIRGIGKLSVGYREQVLQAVWTANELPDDELPARAATQRNGKPSRMVLLFLESVLAAACAEHEIDPALVGGSSQLRALIAWNEGDRAAELTPPLLEGWRGEVCSAPLLDALEGRLSLRISDPLSANPLAVGGLTASPASNGR